MVGASTDTPAAPVDLEAIAPLALFRGDGVDRLGFFLDETAFGADISTGRDANGFIRVVGLVG